MDHADGAGSASSSSSASRADPGAASSGHTAPVSPGGASPGGPGSSATNGPPSTRGPPSSATAPAAPAQTRPHTRSRSGIVKTVQRTDGMVMYACQMVPYASIEPSSYTEAAQHPSWKAAMDEEIDALHRNGTWRLVPPRPGLKVIDSKWVFKLKHKADGSVITKLTSSSRDSNNVLVLIMMTHSARWSSIPQSGFF